MKKPKAAQQPDLGLHDRFCRQKTHLVWRATLEAPPPLRVGTTIHSGLYPVVHFGRLQFGRLARQATRA